VARNAEVKVRIRGDSKSAEQAAKKTESAFRRLGASIKNNLAASMIGATAGVYALVRGFKAVVNAANEQEDAIRALDAALAPLEEHAGTVSKRLQEQAAALQKVTKHGDETIIKGQALVATFTQSEEAIKRSTEAALNLSAAIGMDLNAAFLLMGKAAAGDTATLSRYGIVLDEGIPKSERLAAVLGLIEEKMGGRAQEAAKTFSGRIAQLGNALGDVAERMGEGATKNSELGDAISKLTVFVQDNEAAFAKLWTAIGKGSVALIGGLADKFMQLGDAMGAVVVKINELTGAYDAVGASQAAVEGVAKRLGISVEEVRKRMAAAAHEIHEVNTETDDAADGMENLANKTDKAGGAAEKLTDHFKTATDAAIGLGNALGEVTSIELAVEIEKIQEALAESTAEMDKNGAEYARLERIAIEKIERIRERIRNLRDGLGDLTTKTEESGRAWETYAVGADRAAASIDRLVVSTRGQTRAMAEQASYSGNALGGGSSFTQIGGGTFTYFTPTVTQDADGRLRPG
jgi:chromosome segregation ATPase